MSVNMSGSGAVGLGVGVGSYQPGVYVPLKALFLVISYMIAFMFLVECGGLVVEHQTPYQEILGSNPSQGAVLCP